MRLRRGAWIVLPLVGAAVGGLAWLTQSAWLGRGLEAALEALLRRDVAVEGARLDPFTLQARLERLRIADRDDPRRWAFDGGPAVLDVAFWPLLGGKWVIEDLRLVDVTGGTPRKAPAAWTWTPSFPTAPWPLSPGPRTRPASGARASTPGRRKWKTWSTSTRRSGTSSGASTPSTWTPATPPNCVAN